MEDKKGLSRRRGNSSVSSLSHSLPRRAKRSLSLSRTSLVFPRLFAKTRPRDALPLSLSLPEIETKRKQKRRKESHQSLSPSLLRLHLLARHLGPRARVVAEERDEPDLARHLGLGLALLRLGRARALGVGAARPRGAPGPLPRGAHRRLLQQARVGVDDGRVLRVVLAAERGVVRLGGVLRVVRVPEGAALDGRGGVDL